MVGLLPAAPPWQTWDASRRRMMVLSIALLTAVGTWLTVHDSEVRGATQWLVDIRSSGPLFSTRAVLAEATGRPGTQVQPLSCEPLADVPGKSVTTALITFPPRAYSSAHRHPGSVTAFVVSGSIRSQLAGTPAHVYAAGTTWFEPAGALHLFAENLSPSDSAQLLAVFIADHDCGSLVIPEPTR